MFSVKNVAFLVGSKQVGAPTRHANNLEIVECWEMSVESTRLQDTLFCLNIPCLSA